MSAILKPMASIIHHTTAHEEVLDLSEAGSWTRDQTIAYFCDEHGLDLSEMTDDQLSVFIRCEQRGGDVSGMLESHQRISQAMLAISPEEEALWDKQLQAEGIA